MRGIVLCEFRVDGSGCGSATRTHMPRSESSSHGSSVGTSFSSTAFRLSRRRCPFLSDYFQHLIGNVGFTFRRGRKRPTSRERIGKSILFAALVTLGINAPVAIGFANLQP